MNGKVSGKMTGVKLYGRRSAYTAGLDTPGPQRPHDLPEPSWPHTQIQTHAQALAGPRGVLPVRGWMAAGPG